MSATGRSRILRTVIGVCFVSQFYVAGCSLSLYPSTTCGEPTSLETEFRDAHFLRRGESVEISYWWGVRGRNRVDTVSGTITKDLVMDPPITVPFEIADSDKAAIITFADSIGFWRLPDYIAPPDTTETVTDMTPCSHHVLSISSGHRTKTVMWNTCIANPCAERDRVVPLGKLIRGIVVGSEVYKRLPKAKGGYL